MSNGWKGFGDSDPIQQPPPDWYVWPGLIGVVGGLLYLLKKFLES